MRSTSRSDDGATAVEFALIVPVLMAIVIGTVEFGYRYQQNIEYTNAAMQAARSMSIKNDVAAATAEVRNFTGRKSQEYQQFEDTRVDVNRYKLGRIVSLSATAKF